MARKTGAVPEWVKDITDDPEYQAMLKKRAVAGILPPNAEIQLWKYRWGSPPEEINLHVEDFTSKSTDDLIALNRELQTKLDELRELEAMLASSDEPAATEAPAVH